MDTGINDSMLSSGEIAALPRYRAIAAIVESAIDEFAGEKRTYDGLLIMCRHIAQVLVQNPGASAYEQDYQLWVDAMNNACAKRGIDFDARGTCGALVSLAQTSALEQKETGNFARRISGADVIRARGMGISLR